MIIGPNSNSDLNVNSTSQTRVFKCCVPPLGVCEFNSQCCSGVCNLNICEPDTAFPSRSPSNLGTANPTSVPSKNPTNSPSKAPTNSPTKTPSNSPIQTTSPTFFPTTSPTKTRTNTPTKAPITSPTIFPTTSGSISPTFFPTQVPTLIPTNSPTLIPIVDDQDNDDSDSNDDNDDDDDEDEDDDSDNDDSDNDDSGSDDSSDDDSYSNDDSDSDDDDSDSNDYAQSITMNNNIININSELSGLDKYKEFISNKWFYIFIAFILLCIIPIFSSVYIKLRKYINSKSFKYQRIIRSDTGSSVTVTEISDNNT